MKLYIGYYLLPDDKYHYQAYFIINTKLHAFILSQLFTLRVPFWDHYFQTKKMILLVIYLIQYM